MICSRLEETRGFGTARRRGSDRSGQYEKVFEPDDRRPDFHAPSRTRI